MCRLECQKLGTFCSGTCSNCRTCGSKVTPVSPSLRPVVLQIQAMDAIRTEGEALDELKARTSRECGEKRTALRKLEYQAIERKNR